MLLAGITSGCSNTYRGAPIEGWVVDAQTHQPLEGVVVVVQWELDRGGIHPGIGGRLLLQETVTDKKGRYAFPPWGPMKADDGFLRDSTPYLAFFKRGYVGLGVRNDSSHSRRVPDIWVSKWSGKTLELRAFAGQLSDYYKELWSITFLYGSSYRDLCAWQQMPRMTAELIKLGEACQKEKVDCGTPHPETLRGGGRCGSPDYVLREYLK